jgi:hypothetical protein
MESTTYLLIDEKGKEHGIISGDTLFIGDVGRPDLAQHVIADLTQEKLANHLFDSLRNKIMPLSDDLIVYPSHGAGSACGKNMSKETTDTLGNQKRTNYALRADMTKEEFTKELLDGLVKSKTLDRQIEEAILNEPDIGTIGGEIDYAPINILETNLYGNKAKGTHANAYINKWGRELQAEWMLTKSQTSEEDNPKLNMHSLRSIPYIQECIAWNSDGNFDRVSAAGMLFILREDRYKRTQSAKVRDGNKGSNLANDKFFEKNFKTK